MGLNEDAFVPLLFYYQFNKQGRSSIVACTLQSKNTLVYILSNLNFIQIEY